MFFTVCKFKIWYNLRLVKGILKGDFMKNVVLVSNLIEMKLFAEKIAEGVFPGFVVGLAGDLGAGKTTFTQFFGKALGINDRINSPTFTIMKHYQGDVFLTHVDAYRLEDVMEDEGIEEYLDGDGVSVVEWYPYIVKSMPEMFLKIHIELVSLDIRKITIEGEGSYEAVVSKFGD